jgi:hypothetical protein
MIMFARILAMAGLLALAPIANAQEIRTVPVRFAAGATSTVLRGTIEGRGSVSYTVGAEAGQTLKIALRSNRTALSFNVYAPGRGPGDEALAIGDQQPDPTRFEGKLAVSGTYTVSVFLIRAAARRNERARYTLSIAIPGSAAVAPGPVRNDFADGLQGGPDTWAVAGVPARDTLRLRASPSTKAASLATLANGAVLRNGGCRMVSGQRWCKVETTGGAPVSGWVAGRYLVEGGTPAGAAGPTNLAADCQRLAAVDFLVPPAKIRTAGTRRGPEGPLVDATADLGAQGIKPFACRFDAKGGYLGILSKVDEGKL